MKPEDFKDGIYQMEFSGERHVVEIKDLLMGQYPSQFTMKTAEFLSGSPRFPTSLAGLIAWGAKFKFLK